MDSRRRRPFDRRFLNTRNHKQDHLIDLTRKIMAGYLDYEKIGQEVFASLVRSDEITCKGYYGSKCEIKITWLICHATGKNVLIIEDTIGNKGTLAINIADKALAWFEHMHRIEHGTCIHVLRQVSPLNTMFLLRYIRTGRTPIMNDKGFIRSSPYSRPFYFPITKAEFLDSMETGDFQKQVQQL
ncbi:MAG: hypothetical protein GY938_13030 [Ketobacter sp.]|nr:hypothetical protein [Ketobacter sp.]